MCLAIKILWQSVYPQCPPNIAQASLYPLLRVCAAWVVITERERERMPPCPLMEAEEE